MSKKHMVGNTLGYSLLLWLCGLTSASASDIDIYSTSSNGNKTMMLMVDTSKTMGTPALDVLRDYPLCMGGSVLTPLQGALSAVGVNNLNLAGIVVNKKGDTGVVDSAQAGEFCDIILPEVLLSTLETVDSLAPIPLLGLKGTVDYIKNSCEPLSSAQNTAVQLGQFGYRCYSRLGRIKNAVRAVLDESSSSAIDADVKVGLSVFPARNSTSNNDKAGMVLLPARTLDWTDGSGVTQRQLILNKINTLHSDSRPLGEVTSAVGSLLTGDVTGLTSLVTNLLGGLLGGGLSVENIVGVVDDLLGTSSDNVATASAYAETGAYLLSNTTAGTGSQVVAKKVTNGYVLKCPVTNSNSTNVRCTGEWQEERYCSLHVLTCIAYSWREYVRGGEPSHDTQDAQFYYQNSSQSTAYSGFGLYSDSSSKSSDLTRYADVTLSPNNDQCGGQGIYVLTGNVPSLGGDNNLQSQMQRLMRQSLSQNINSGAFTCNVDQLTGGSATATWGCIEQYSQWLQNKTGKTNSKNVLIKTAVAGIGREFSVNPQPENLLGLVKNTLGLGTILDGLGLGGALGSVDKLLGLGLSSPNQADINNLRRWGEQGGVDEGGWYAEAGGQSLADSIAQFVDGLPSVEGAPFVGTLTVPADPVNAFELQNNAYKTLFEPTTKPVWFGNLKKYTVLQASMSTDNPIGTTDQWSNSNSDDIFTGGILNKLPLFGLTFGIKTPPSHRHLLVNRSCSQVDHQFQASNSLTAVNDSYIDATCTDAQGTALLDSQRGYLMALLGYDIAAAVAQAPSTDNLNSTVLNSTPELRQVGAPFHSTPVLLTQSATFNDQAKVTERDDYLLFGSTQGLLHVVDADTGVEKLAFLPNELLEKTSQQAGFLNKHTLSGTVSNMPYGVDAPWVAYSEYVRDKTGLLTVGTAQVDNDSNNDLHGKQWVYGGLRMGGRSYYALDLSDMDSPALKFYIDPVNQRVVNTAGSTSYSALQYMGQSWSKPTITWVSWKGERKLVMFVGGGYDMNGTVNCSTQPKHTNKGYECPTYAQSNQQGAGVYMFDANTGDLLWWASASATDSNTGNTHSKAVADMKYSVVSRINAIDRDGDHLVDHVYFGDLGGQLWRIDLDNSLSSTANSAFAKHATRLLNVHAAHGLSPRFYEAPTFSVYGDANPLAVLNIASGDRSSPLASQVSAVLYTVFDRDVSKKDLYTLSALSATNTLSDLTNYTAGFPSAELSVAEQAALKGWYYVFADNGDHVKSVMSELTAINSNLYVSVYDPATDDSANESTCGLGVKGLSQIQRFCLPYGTCKDGSQNQSDANRLDLGQGIVDMVLGAGDIEITDDGVEVNDSAHIRKILGIYDAGDPNLGAKVMAAHESKRKLVPLRWYEQYAISP